MDKTTLHDAIAGISYPASKADLLERARENEADPEVIEVLERLPALTFASSTEVTSQLTAVQ